MLKTFFTNTETYAVEILAPLTPNPGTWLHFPEADTVPWPVYGEIHIWCHTLGPILPPAFFTYCTLQIVPKHTCR